MEHYSFTETGAGHRKNHHENQDRMLGISGEKGLVVCLCDGAGFSPYSAAAAQLVSQICTKRVYRELDRFFYLPDEQIKARLECMILRALSRYARQCSIPPEQLAATFLLAAVTPEGRYLVTHLGDGAAMLHTGAENCYQLLSPPSNGLSWNTTFLTMNCRMRQYMRVYRSMQCQPREILLVTDGADHLLRPAPAQRTLPCPFDGPSIHRYLMAKKPEDDYSGILIRVP